MESRKVFTGADRTSGYKGCQVRETGRGLARQARVETGRPPSFQGFERSGERAELSDFAGIGVFLERGTYQ